MLIAQITSGGCGPIHIETREAAPMPAPRTPLESGGRFSVRNLSHGMAEIVGPAGESFGKFCSRALAEQTVAALSR